MHSVIKPAENNQLDKNNYFGFKFPKLSDRVNFRGYLCELMQDCG